MLDHIPRELVCRKTIKFSSQRFSILLTKRRKSAKLPRISKKKKKWAEETKFASPLSEKKSGYWVQGKGIEIDETKEKARDR